MKLDKLNERLAPYNKAAVAREIGISRSLLNHKLKGRSQFTFKQVRDLKKALRLTSEEFEDIFFNEE